MEVFIGLIIAAAASFIAGFLVGRKHGKVVDRAKKAAKDVQNDLGIGA